VLVSYGGQGVVILGDGERKTCKFRRRVGRPYCGDRVLVAPADEASLVVETVLPRKNYFVRTDDRLRQHIIAANLDQEGLRQGQLAGDPGADQRADESEDDRREETAARETGQGLPDRAGDPGDQEQEQDLEH